MNAGKPTLTEIRRDLMRLEMKHTAPRVFVSCGILSNGQTGPLRPKNPEQYAIVITCGLKPINKEAGG